VKLAEVKAHYASLEAYAGARLVTLGDGGERGVRVIELRSGGGLDLEVVVDRGFDIGRVACKGSTVSWHAAHGLRAPWLTDASSDRGQGFLRGASGFLVTCGLDHIRQPETDTLDAAPLYPSGEIDYPLHGQGTGQPARLIGYGLDDAGDEPFLWAEGEVIQSMTFRGALRLTRRVTVPLGGSSFSIVDRVTNIGPFASTHMLLYHFNLGHPLIDAGSTIEVPDSRVTWRGTDHDPLAPIAAPQDEHSADLSIFAMGPGRCAACRVRSPRGFSLDLSFDQAALPFLQMLRMGGRGLYGLGLEPCTSGARSRREARAQQQMILLHPGDSRNYTLDISLSAAAG
jgi:hypothetical protein